jgi:hypothetical protein
MRARGESERGAVGSEGTLAGRVDADPHTTKEPAIVSSAPDRQTGTAVAKFHDERDILRQ